MLDTRESGERPKGFRKEEGGRGDDTHPAVPLLHGSGRRSKHRQVGTANEGKVAEVYLDLLGLLLNQVFDHLLDAADLFTDTSTDHKTVAFNAAFVFLFLATVSRPKKPRSIL